MLMLVLCSIGAQAADDPLTAFVDETARDVSRPAAPFLDAELIPPGLDAGGLENWLRREQPGLAAEFAQLDRDARIQVFVLYRTEPRLTTLRQGILERSRP